MQLKMHQPSAKTIRLGLIGAGAWGRNFIRTIQSNAAYCLDYVVSTNPDTLSLVSSDTTVCSSYETIPKDSLDGIIIATPPESHIPIALAGLERGTPVLLEKPISTNISETKKFLESAIRNNYLLLIDYIYLYHEGFLKFKERFSHLNFRLKTPQHFIFRSGQYGPFRNGVTVIWDWLVHDIAMLHECLGDFSIHSISVNRIAGEPFDHEKAVYQIDLSLDNDVTVEMVVGNLMEKKNRYIECQFGGDRIIFNPISSEKVNMFTASGVSASYAYSNQVTPLQNVLNAFATLIESRKPNSSVLSKAYFIESTVNFINQKVLAV